MQDPEQVIDSLKRTDGCTHVLLITTGSVASIKAPLIVKELLSVRVVYSSMHSTGVSRCMQYQNVKVEVISTKASMAFFDVQAIRDAGSRVWRDEDDWRVSRAEQYFDDGTMADTRNRVRTRSVTPSSTSS